VAEGVFERLDEEMVAPDDAFVHAQSFVDVIDAAFEDALPALVFVGEMLVR
jgi:hypothetical protein